MDKKYILSYGGGVNSTALLFWLFKNNKPLDEVIFADTGAEMPNTYKFIPKIKDFCKHNNIKFTILKSKINLKDYCITKNIIPFRHFRFCTDRFKIRIIQKYLKQYNCKIILYIGFDFGELNRVRNSKINWIENKYPLIGAEINRHDCEIIIKEMGFELPVKSGCYFCPFQNYNDWINLRKNYPDLFKIAIKLENNAVKRNKNALFWLRSLKNIDRAEKEQKRLEIKSPCMGWCRT